MVSYWGRQKRPTGFSSGVLAAGSAWNYGADLWFDFQKGIGQNGSLTVAPAALITDTHPQAILSNNLAGVYSSFGVDTLVMNDAGLQTVPTRTYVALHNRDLTNAVWTKSNATAAKNQTGILGVANSASSLTATAGNGTCLQAITLASSARFQTAFVKRLVGTGAVEMTMDNGATWTAITGSLTADWTRVSIPTQTLANPTVGFRIVTSGDSIAVDYVQNENSTFATPPVEVAGVAVSVTGNRQVISNLGTPLANGVYGLVQTDIRGFSNLARVLAITGATTNDVINIEDSGGTLVLEVTTGGVAQAFRSMIPTPIEVVTLAFAVGTNFAAARAVGQGAITNDTTVTYPAVDRIGFGGNALTANNNIFGNCHKVALWYGAPGQAQFDDVFAKAQLAAA